VDSPVPIPRRQRTGFSGSMRATIDPSKVPAAVAQLWGDRQNQEELNEAYAQRLARVERKIKMFGDDRTRVIAWGAAISVLWAVATFVLVWLK